MKKQNLSVMKQADEAMVAVVPAGGIVGADAYFENGPRLPSKARRLPVLQGAFNAAEFNLDEASPWILQHGIMALGKGMPVLAFTLQSGATRLFWFANIADPAVWEMLEAWDAARTMARAAHFDDGRVQFAIEPFRMPEELPALHDLALQRPDFTRAFQDTMAHMYAQTATAPDLVTSELPQTSEIAACSDERGNHRSYRSYRSTGRRTASGSSYASIKARGASNVDVFERSALS